MQAITQAEIEEFRQNHIGRLFLRAQRDFSERAIQKLQTRGYQGAVLTYAAVLPHLDVDGTRIVTLAERAQITKQSAGQFVQELEEAGYVERLPDSQDKRAVMIKFTEKGWQFLHDAYEVKQEIEAEYRHIIGDVEFEALKGCLERLLQSG